MSHTSREEPQVLRAEDEATASAIQQLVGPPTSQSGPTTSSQDALPGELEVYLRLSSLYSF